MGVTRRQHVLAQAHTPGRWLWFNFLAVVAGALGGLGALALKALTQMLVLLFSLPSIPVGEYNVATLFVPVAGALCFTWITTRWVPDTRGSGMPEIIHAAALQRGRIKPHVGPAKLLATSLTVASGGSTGTEGPAAFIGASFASLLARATRLTPFETRVIMVSGIAGGVAGMFGTPFGGALFALEVIFRGVGIFSIIPAFLASVMGYVVVSAFTGAEVAFPVAIEWPVMNFEFYAIFIVFGAIFGLIAFAWVKFMYHAQRFYARLKIAPWKVPVLGAIMMGLLAFSLPGLGITGTGYDGISHVLAGSITSWSLLVLGLIKIVATASTVSSGGSGGVFGPSLFIGCAFGGFIGHWACLLFPGVGLTPELFALVGMGALFAGAAQAPIHIIVMMAEITRNFSIVPPLIIAAATCFIVSWMLLRGSSIYTAKLEARGIKLGNESFFLLQNVSVGEIMTRKPVTARASSTVGDLARILGDDPFQVLPVVDGTGRHAGVVARGAYLAARGAGRSNKDEISTMVDASYPVIGEGDLVQAAMDLMVEKVVGALPVASKDDKDIIVGIITDKDVKRLFGTLT